MEDWFWLGASRHQWAAVSNHRLKRSTPTASFNPSLYPLSPTPSIPMHPQIETIFDEAEHRYLKAEELGVISQYVSSLPERLETYRALRDRELEIMQQVADQLEVSLPQESVDNLERSLKNALLLLRYSAMGMLLNDEAFVQERLVDWLTKTMSLHNTRTIDTALFRLLNQRLMQALTAKQINLVGPYIAKVQTAILQAPTLAAVGS
jgi:hypothetical protein